MNSVVGLPIHGFLLLNSNMWLNAAPLQDIRLRRNLSGLDFDLSRSLKVECDGVI